MRRYTVHTKRTKTDRYQWENPLSQPEKGGRRKNQDGTQKHRKPCIALTLKIKNKANWKGDKQWTHAQTTARQRGNTRGREKGKHFKNSRIYSRNSRSLQRSRHHYITLLSTLCIPGNWLHAFLWHSPLWKQSCMLSTSCLTCKCIQTACASRHGDREPELHCVHTIAQWRWLTSHNAFTCEVTGSGAQLNFWILCVC